MLIVLLHVVGNNFHKHAQAYICIPRTNLLILIEWLEENETNLTIEWDGRQRKDLFGFKISRVPATFKSAGFPFHVLKLLAFLTPCFLFYDCHCHPHFDDTIRKPPLIIHEITNVYLFIYFGWLGFWFLSEWKNVCLNILSSR